MTKIIIGGIGVNYDGEELSAFAIAEADKKLYGLKQRSK